MIEVTNDDVPYLRPDNLPSATVVDRVTVALPTCEPGGTSFAGGPLGGPQVLPERVLAATGKPWWTAWAGAALLAAGVAGWRASRVRP